MAISASAAITEVFLETNGFELTMANEEIVGVFLAIASQSLSREQIEQLDIGGPQRFQQSLIAARSLPKST